MTFIAVRVLLSPLVGETVCRDGWRSASIGSRGACSWHGGVGGLDRGGWVLPLSVLAGVGGGLLARRVKEFGWPARRPDPPGPGQAQEGRVQRTNAWCATLPADALQTGVPAKLMLRTRSGWPVAARVGENPLYPVISVHFFDQVEFDRLYELSQRPDAAALNAAWSEIAEAPRDLLGQSSSSM